MKRLLSLVLTTMFIASLTFIFPTFIHAQRTPANVWQNTNMSHSFMQVLSPTTIRMRNILLTINGSKIFCKQDFSLKSGNFVAIPGTLVHEEGYPYPYILPKVPNGSITIDSNFNDWKFVWPAPLNVYLDSQPRPGIDPGLDIFSVRLARDDEFLYVLITMHGPPPFYPADQPPATYFFEARNVPEDNPFSFYTGAIPTPDGLGHAFLNIHYRYNLTDPDPDGPPETVNIKTYPLSTGHGVTGYYDETHFVEWKIPLSDFPIEALEGKYTEAWTGRPPLVIGPIDSTENDRGHWLIVER
jgi:hypothetical protein